MAINLKEKYKELREELPKPFKAKCTGCNTEMITYIDASYIHNKDDRIKLFRPSNCPECAEADGLLVLLVGEIADNGKLYPKNKTRRPR